MPRRLDFSLLMDSGVERVEVGSFWDVGRRFFTPHFLFQPRFFSCKLVVWVPVVWIPKGSPKMKGIAT